MPMSYTKLPSMAWSLVYSKPSSMPNLIGMPMCFGVSPVGYANFGDMLPLHQIDNGEWLPCTFHKLNQSIKNFSTFIQPDTPMN